MAFARLISLHVESLSSLLQRIRTAERAKFQPLIGEARRELAHHYLLRSSLELNGTAYLFAAKMANSLFAHFTSRTAPRLVQWPAAQCPSRRLEPRVAFSCVILNRQIQTYYVEAVKGLCRLQAGHSTTLRPGYT